jgi:DNA modification methylase
MWMANESACICRASEPIELVIDPFVGGGSSASAAASLGRRFLGCDVDAGALMQTRVRLEQEVGATVRARAETT